MKLSQLLAKERELQIEIDDDVLTVTYRPSEFTPELEDRFMTMMETNRSGGALAKYLSGLIITWDLEDESGIYPISEESLARLPIAFLNQVAEKLIEDSNPKKTSVENSFASSRRKAH